ncbi:MAG: glycosyltransferase [Candidatus Latescibacteria bacterium]|nr:glycosyltransferase [Candidatus Latescibacterota bacterium]
MEKFCRRANTAIRHTLLFIAYHYPPIRSSGTERALHFARRLPEFGYAPVVLTTAAFGGASDTQVQRAWEPLKLYRQLWNREARAGTAPSDWRTDPGPLRGLVRLARRWALFPDLQITWVPFALQRALQVVERDAPAALYSTYPPASAHLLGLLLKRRTGLPWVADFRDAWTTDPLEPDLPAWRQALERQLEQAVVEAADVVVAATELSAEYLIKRYARAASRVRVITNGFDPEEFSGIQAAPPADGLLRLVHTGSFSYSHPQRSPQPLFMALEALLAEDRAWAGRLRLVLAGSLSPAEHLGAAALEAAGMVECLGSLERRQALELQQQAHLLLLVDHPRPWPASNVPGKFYEYLAARRPILALCGPGMVAELTRRLGIGLHAPPDDAGAIRQVLVEAWERFGRDQLHSAVAAEELTRFHRRELTGQLARCFDSLLATR